MNTPSAPDAGDILRSLRLLRSPEPTDRQHGIAILAGLVGDWRVQQVFEHLHTHDPDVGVRAAAWLALSRQLPAPSSAAQPSQSAVIPAAHPAISAAREAGTKPRLFLLNLANAPAVVRTTRRQIHQTTVSRREKRLTFWLAGVLLMVSCVLWGIVAPAWFTWLQLERSGVTTRGEVTALQVRPAPDGDQHYYVIYRFTAGRSGEDEAIYSGEQRIEPVVFDRMAEDTPVTVIYLPDDPETSRLDKSDPVDQDHQRLTAGAALLTLSLPLLILWRRLRTRRLEAKRRRKRLVRGQVVDCYGYLDRDGDYTVKLRYRFIAPTGQTFSGQAVQIRNDLKMTGLPVPGTPVAVYYHGPAAHRVL